MQYKDRVTYVIAEVVLLFFLIRHKDKVDHSILAEETISVISTCILGQTDSSLGQRTNGNMYISNCDFLWFVFCLFY